MPDSRTKIRVVVVEFETQANMKASGRGRRYRKSAGCLTRARKKKRKRKGGLQIWSSLVDATRRRSPDLGGGRPRGNAARIVVGVEAGSTEAGRAGVVQVASVSIGGRRRRGFWAAASED
jgi:hypothetical protein